MDFNGLNMGLGNLSRLSKAVSRSISAENFTGEKGKGAMADEGTGSQCARDLGRGWKVSPSINIDPSTLFTLAEIEGPGAVQSIWITGTVTRDMIIRIYWDGQEHPSVECPLPDFFALPWGPDWKDKSGLHSVKVNSLPVSVNPRSGMNCFWEMPFRKSCRITLENRHPENQAVCYFQINYTLTEIPEESAYFHARFNRTNPLPYKTDYIIVDEIKGKGHYVGTSMGFGINHNGWWGEGEIKFFMDGDKEYPTICGTGTEDYFGGSYNWDVGGEYEIYTTPYLGMHQVICPDGTYQAQHRHGMYRWHIMDPIRFEENLRVTIQALGWRDGGTYLPGMHDICSTAFWYQSLPSAPFTPLMSREELAIN
jgi:hypothetical protein